MADIAQPVRWSTDTEEARHRLDLYAATLSSALVPMHLASPEEDDFYARMSMADLGPLSVIRQQGSAHRCYQGPRDAAIAPERSYHLIVNLATPWTLEHRKALRMQPGDIVLVDSALPWDIHSPNHYEYLNLKLGEAWLRQWLPSPGVLTGRRLGEGSGWGRALTAFFSQLTPEFVAGLALQQSLVIDHIGALLALSAGELAGATTERATPAEKDLHRRIDDCIVERCAELTLTADQVAASVNVSVRTLHRCLGARGKSFGARLIDARATIGIRMLESVVFRRLTVAEIARRAGFSDASHFVRVVRGRTGRTPSQIRPAAR